MDDQVSGAQANTRYHLRDTGQLLLTQGATFVTTEARRTQRMGIT